MAIETAKKAPTKMPATTVISAMTMRLATTASPLLRRRAPPADPIPRSTTCKDLVT